MTRKKPDGIDDRFHTQFIADVFKVFERHGYKKSTDEDAISMCVYLISRATRAFEGDIT